MTPEESDAFEQKILSILDGVVYGSLSIEDAVFQLFQLVKEERKNANRMYSNHGKEYTGKIAIAIAL